MIAVMDFLYQFGASEYGSKFMTLVAAYLLWRWFWAIRDSRKNPNVDTKSYARLIGVIASSFTLLTVILVYM